MYNTPAMMSTSRPSTTRKDNASLSTPVLNQAQPKRKELKDASDGPAASKRSRRSTQSKGRFFCSSKLMFVIVNL